MENYYQGSDQVHFTKQENMSDCGAASLSMIIKYYGGYINLDALRYLTKTNKSGTNAYNIIMCARELGFKAYGIKTKIDKKIVLPAIAHMTIDKKYDHFIVVYKITKKFVTIADPNDKVKRISLNKFLSEWNNFFICLYPIKKIPFKKDTSLWVFIFNYLKYYKKTLFHLFILSIILLFFTTTSSLYFKFIIDNNYSKNMILMLFLIFSILTLIKNITSFFRNKVSILLNQKIDLMLVSNVFSKIMSLPYSYFRDNSTGDIVSRVYDMNIIKDSISKIIITLFMDIPLIIISLILLISINYSLFVITIILVMLYFIVSIIFKKTFNYYIDKIQTNKAFVSSYLVESIKNFETVKGLNIDLNNNFQNKYLDFLDSDYKFSNMYNFQMYLKDNIYDVGNLIIIFYGMILVINKKITVGTLLTYNTIMYYFINPIKNVIELNYILKEASNSIKRICSILKDSKSNGIIDKPLLGDINIHSLNHSQVSIKDISINNGSKVRIIGPTGVGKSSLLKILMKYYNVKRDMVYIDNIDINDIKDSSIHKSFAYISQQENLFNDTIYKNISITNENRNDIIKISNLCLVDQIVKNCPLGYNTIINEDGFNISGGERQRIVLACTLLRNFNVLLIDEGLNQLDIKIERIILKNLFTYYKDKTIIIVSHRINNKDLFDSVLN